MTLRITMLTAIFVVLALCAAVAFLAAPIVTEYRALARAHQGHAYTLGIQMALNSEHVHAIWDGKNPTIHFQSRTRDPNNKYVWQEAKLVRSAACLNLVSNRGSALTPPDICATPDVLQPAADRLHYKVRPDGAITIGVSSKPAEAGTQTTSGAMFGIEGQIGLGRSYDTATFFHVQVDATDLDVVDLTEGGNPNAVFKPEEGGSYEDCDRLRSVKLSGPYIFSLLPATLARVCRFRSKDGLVLSLVLFQRGWMQLTRASDVVMCRALLAQLLSKRGRNLLTGCLGAPWNRRDSTAVSLVLFDPNAAGGAALYR